MSIKKIKPTTPGQRFRIACDFAQLTKKSPEKSLLYGVKRTGGRNNTGKITVPHRGGGHKRRARIIDFKRSKTDITGVVKAIEYDPMRTAFIMLVYYQDGEKAYITAPKGIKIGDKIMAGQTVPLEPGNTMPLKNIPNDTVVHNIELNPGAGAICARSAGAYAQLVGQQGKNRIIKLPSGETRVVNSNCMATIGVVSNGEHRSIILGKAGRKRWLSKGPNVRATAMNPVDHGMGGGEGKHSGGHPRSKAGLSAKGARTRKRNKYSAKMILKRRK